MNVLILIPSLPQTSPGSRFRIEQWASHLEEVGFRLTIASFEDEVLHRTVYQPGRYVRKAFLMARATVRRASLLPMIRKQDVVFVYEEATRVGPPIIEWLIKMLRVPLVYDFCDPIYLPYKSPSNGHLSRLKFFGKYARICRMSTHVIAGNEPLAEFARKYSDSVSVVPITIDTDRYTQRTPPDRNRVPVIGWSGSSTTVPHLESIADPLRRLAKTERFQLKVVGTTPPTRLNDVPMSFVPWRSETEVAELQAMDIGIMPLPDDPWTRLRTQLKVRQYMGVGVPAVASPVGLLPELIQDGENGFLAATSDEWVDRLSRLILDPMLREHVGQQGRATIEAQYSARVWAPRVAEILRQATSGR